MTSARVVALGDSMREPLATLTDAASDLRKGSTYSAGDMAVAIRKLITVWRNVAAGEPVTLTQDELPVGTRVMVQPFTQCAATRGSSRPLRIPFAVPATVTESHIPDSVMVQIDENLYGHRAWQTERQLFIPSRGELHAEKCTCAICQYGDLLGA